MTRQCCYCKKEMGEKCPLCGGETHLIEELRWKHAAGFFACVNPEPAAERCFGKIFEKGMGGITSGVCADCAIALRGSRKPTLVMEKTR